MDILRFIGIVIAGIIIIASCREFLLRCENKFEHSFISTSSFVYSLIASGLLIGGEIWRQDAIKNQGDLSNGVVLIFMGFTVFALLVINNYRKTNFIYGTIGTSLQLIVFYFGFWFVLIFGFMFIFLWLLFPSFRLWWIVKD